MLLESRRYIRPGKLQRAINPWMVRLGVPALAIRGRRTGNWYVTPVTPLKLDGQMYVVAGRGQADWVLNLRKAGGGELRRGRRTVQFRGVELQGPEQERIVNEYRRRYGRAVKPFFDQMPDPADHPAFRVDFIEN